MEHRSKDPASDRKQRRWFPNLKNNLHQKLRGVQSKEGQWHEPRKNKFLALKRGGQKQRVLKAFEAIH